MAQTIIVDTTPGFMMPTIYFSQGDIGTTFNIDIQSRFGDTLPASPTVTIQATKPSGLGYSVTADSISNGIAVFTFTSTMTNEAGRFPAELKIAKGGVTLYTANFYMEGEASAHPEGTTDGDLDNILPKYVSVTTTTLPAGDSATYSYDPATNTATFGIPKGADGSLSSAILAPTYSSSSTYSVGDYVYYNGNLYICSTAITTAEAWTAGHWTQVTLSDEISDVKGDINGLIREYAEAIPMTYTINNNRIAILDAFYTIKNGYMCKVILLKITTSSITSANAWTLGNLSPYANYKYGDSYIDYTAVSLSGGNISGMTFRQSSGTSNNFSVITTGAVSMGQGGVIMLTHKQAINDPTKAIADTEYPIRLINKTQRSEDLYNSDFTYAGLGWRVSTHSLSTLSGYKYIMMRAIGGSSIAIKGLSETLGSYGYAILDSSKTVLEDGGESPGMIIDIPDNGYWLVFTYPANDTISFIPYYKTNVVVLGDSWSDNDPDHTTYTKWTTLLQQDGRYKVKVYAQNGSWITGDTPDCGLNGNVLGQFNQLKTDNLKNVDIVVLMGGINDFRGGVANSAVYNKLSYFYTELNKLYPSARIIYISNNQIYITQQQMDYFNVIIDVLREDVGMEAFTSFGWVKANHYISDHVHVDNDGYRDLYANILSILTGGQLHSMKTSYQHVVNDESENYLFSLGLYETWDDGHVSYAAKLIVPSVGLGKTADITLSAGDGNVVASVPFTKIINKAFADSIGLDGAVIYSDVAESFTTANKMNTSLHIRVITPSANNGTYMTDNYN